MKYKNVDEYCAERVAPLENKIIELTAQLSQEKQKVADLQQIVDSTINATIPHLDAQEEKIKSHSKKPSKKNQGENLERSVATDQQ